MNASATQPNSTAGWRAQYPFQSHYQQWEGLRYHYLDEGQGEPLLMVHGNPTWSFYWRRLVSAFSGRYRAVVPDHIGCGLSDKPQRYDYTLRQHTDNLLRLIRALDLRQVNLLVHDWGGAIGLGAAVAEPHRFARLVLFNTGAFPPPFIPWRIRACRLPLLGTLAVRGANLFARAAVRMAVEKPERMRGGTAEGLLAPYGNWHDRVAIDRFVRDIPLSPRHPTWQTLVQLEQKLPSLESLPIQMIWGMRDWCFRPSCLEQFQQIWPHSEVHKLQDAGHYVVEDAHEQIVPLVESFLARTPATSVRP